MLKDNYFDPRYTQFKSYLFGDGDDVRLTLFHGLCKPDFIQTLEVILAEYGLAQRIAAAIDNPAENKVQILDVGCGEGLYLHDVAALLEQKSLLVPASVELNGLDINAAAISTAELFRKQAQPPRPYLNFYLWDVTLPLERCHSLSWENKLEFDFIYVLRVLNYIPESRQVLHELYKCLKPGGVLYLCDIVAGQGEQAIVSPLPAIASISAAFDAYNADLRGGVDLTNVIEAWLKAEGALKIQSITTKLTTGPETGQAGLDLLRFWVKSIRSFGQALVTKGRITEDEYKHCLAIIFKELHPGLYGHFTFKHTFAQKPAQ